MNTNTIPNFKENFILNLPKEPSLDLNWMGKLIYWIRDTENHGLIRRVIVSTIAILISLALLASVVLSPLFIYGYKEYIRQCERSHFNAKYNELRKMARDFGRQHFLKGRIDPLKKSNTCLWGSVRKKIIADLELKDEEAKKLKDTELVCMAAIKYDNYLERYGLRIKNNFFNKFLSP